MSYVFCSKEELFPPVFYLPPDFCSATGNKMVKNKRQFVPLKRGNLGAIPNFATEKEPKRNFLYLTDVTLVIVDIKSERFIKRTVHSRTCLI